MYQCPIDYYAGNLIFNADKSCWAAFKLVGFDYDFLSLERKIAILYKTARFLAGTMSELQILILPVDQNTKEHFRTIRNRLNKRDVLYKRAYDHALQTEQYLREVNKQRGDTNDYRCYIIAKLEEYTESVIIDNLKEAWNFFVKDPTNSINVLMNLDTVDILASKVEKMLRLGDKYFFAANQKMSMVPVVEEEQQWLFRRTCFRGINERVNLFYKDTGLKKWRPRAEVIQEGTEKIIKPYKRDTINLFSGTITSANRVLKVDHGGGKVSYQTFLALSNIPDEIEFPGLEWIYMLQRYNLQAEACIHIKAVEYRAALRKVDAKKREINSQMEHIDQADSDIPEELLEGNELADPLEGELKDNRFPLLNTCVTFCLASDNKKNLEEKVEIVKNEYEDLNFILERPVADQFKLFMSMIPSVSNTISDYQMQLSPMTLASGIIGATHELGDNRGPYIGTTGAEGKQVFLEMGYACLKNKSASATFFGNLGFGKSFNANLLVLLNVLYGGYGLIFDPKGERSHWEYEFTLLKDCITTVTLAASPENKGKLDPYNVYRDDIHMANELALNVISELFKIPPTSLEYTALLYATKVIREEAEHGISIPSMKRLIEILDNFDASDDLQNIAKMLSRRLDLQSAAGMAQLLIGDGTEEAINLDNRLNILQIQNLKLPSPEVKKEDYTSEETLSTVLMMVIAHFAKKFALTKRPVFKSILFDESWALGKTAEGVKLYDYLSRMGRSLYTGCIFNGHSVLDIPTEGIKNTITYKFCFNTQNDVEAERMCSYMGLDITEENKDIFKRLRNGQCMFMDLDGHVGVLQFDAVFQDIIEVFSTTPVPDEKKTHDEPKETVEDVPEVISELPEEMEELSYEPDEAKEEYTDTFVEDVLLDADVYSDMDIDIFEREVL